MSVNDAFSNALGDRRGAPAGGDTPEGTPASGRQDWPLVANCSTRSDRTTTIDLQHAGPGLFKLSMSVDAPSYAGREEAAIWTGAGASLPETELSRVASALDVVVACALSGNYQAQAKIWDDTAGLTPPSAQVAVVAWEGGRLVISDVGVLAGEREIQVAPVGDAKAGFSGMMGMMPPATARTVAAGLRAEVRGRARSPLAV
jgi:hypothetical protein